MGKRKQLRGIVGNKYGSVTVIDRSVVNVRAYVCLCDCGKIFETMKQRLENGSTSSCGCMSKSLRRAANIKHGGYKDGKNTPEYSSYISMMDRCFNEKSHAFHLYGGNGILVIEPDWILPCPDGFLNFRRDMGDRPEGTSLDRVDGYKGYSKENCRWATRRIQSVNTNRNKTEKNTSKYRGVSLKGNKFVARIGNGLGGYEWLGSYYTEELAAEAYNKRALELHGSDAKLNLIVYEEE